MRKPAFCICENKDADQLRVMFVLSIVLMCKKLIEGVYIVIGPNSDKCATE